MVKQAKTGAKTETKTGAKTETETKTKTKQSIKPETLKKIQTDPTWANTVTIPTLVKHLKIFADTYFNGVPLINDSLYDQLIAILETRDPKNKFLKKIGSKPDVNNDGVEVTLPYFMPSLNKIVSDKAKLDKWTTKYTGPYILSDKLDGISGLLVKDVNNNVKLYTRGGGEIGTDISTLIKYILTETIISSIPTGMAIRGEIIMSRKNFENIKKTVVTKNNKELQNSRNTISGLVNSKTIDHNIANYTTFVAYSILEPVYDAKTQMQTLEKIGIPTVTWSESKVINIDMLTEYFKLRKDMSIYDIDGIVVTDNEKPYVNTENDNPDFSFAYKDNSVLDVAISKVVNVIWSASKDTYLIPTVAIEPVALDGVTVTNATGHHAKFILDNGIGTGATIEVIRSGSVIPYITKTITSTKAQMPNIPKVDYEWTKTGIDIKYIGSDPKILAEINVAICTFFFSKLAIKYISEGIIKKLVDLGYDTPIKIISANKEELYKIDGLGKTIINKIYTNIDNCFKTVPLELLMSASNKFGRGLGSKKLKLILGKYPNILDMCRKSLVDKTEPNGSETTKKPKTTKKPETTEEQLELIGKIVEIKGFDTKTATRFIKRVTSFIEFYDQLNKILDGELKKRFDIIAATPVKIKTGIFTNKTVVMTNTRDKEIIKFIENNGGTISSTTTGKTSLVVYSLKKGPSSNYTKALKLSIPVIEDVEFKKKYELV